MRKETKDTVYMALDLLDSIVKTSKNNSSFICIDENVLKVVKDELFELLAKSPYTQEERTKDRKTELVGILPSILIDKNKFPNNEDIVKLAEKSLNFKPPNWKKKSRTEIIGIIINKITTEEEQELELFFSAWKEFIRDEPHKKEEKKDFIDVWLEFFDHYKEQK